MLPDHETSGHETHELPLHAEFLTWFQMWEYLQRQQLTAASQSEPVYNYTHTDMPTNNECASVLLSLHKNTEYLWNSACSANPQQTLCEMQ